MKHPIIRYFRNCRGSFWCVPLSVTDVKTINYLCLWVTRFLWPDQRRGVNMILSRWRILWHRKNWQSWGECEMKGLNICWAPSPSPWGGVRKAINKIAQGKTSVSFGSYTFLIYWKNAYENMKKMYFHFYWHTFFRPRSHLSCKMMRLYVCMVVY